MDTFLFSDIEGSTRLLRQLGDEAAAVMGRHHEILRDSMTAHDGVVRRTEGDSFFATFVSPTSAVEAAVTAQTRLAAEPWPVDNAVRVRIGIHTGEAEVAADEYIGMDVHRAARIMSAGWGGQILVSAATAAHVSAASAGVKLHDLGAHRLKDLTEPVQILQVVAPALRADFPALRSLNAAPVNLPTQLTSFVGREREVADVVALLTQTRALTLTGPGGTGKTRLSLHVARGVADDFGDGVFFVPLASVTDPALVMSAIARVLGLANAGGQTPLEVVIDYLRDRRPLLVLDNFEHVLPAAVEVSKLLADAPAVTALITSRAPLRMSGEQEYPVPPLRLPDAASRTVADVAASEAVTLFLARAANIRPDFFLTEEDAPAVADIVQRLDGLPLAIELAASRVRVLPVTAIAGRLGDALNLLSSGARDLPDRQRTLRGAIAWSHDLLDEASRTLFARLSVFRGGADLERLEEVAGPGLHEDAFEVVADLVDHSLLRRTAADGSPRFQMLETIREYAAERLEARGEHEELRRRHAQVFLELAQTARPHLTGPESGVWLDRLERDHDNLRAALRRSVADGDTRTALRFVWSLWRLWQIRGHIHEARRTIDIVAGLPDAPAHPRELAAACEAGGGVAYWQADPDTAARYYERALDLYRQVGDESAVARGLYNLAFAYGLRDTSSAAGVFEQALAAYERLGDERGIGNGLWGMAVGSMWARDYDALVQYGERSVAIFRATGATFDLSWALHLRGIGELAFARHDSAEQIFAECLDMFLASNDASGYYLALSDFALLAEARGQAERALRLRGAVERIGEETGTGLLRLQLGWVPRSRHAENEVDAVRAATLKTEGLAMTRSQAIDYARKT